jgi:hypothetical protein
MREVESGKKEEAIKEESTKDESMVDELPSSHWDTLYLVSMGCLYFMWSLYIFILVWTPAAVYIIFLVPLSIPLYLAADIADANRKALSNQKQKKMK